MHTTTSSGPYVPQISRSAVFVLRRLAWLSGKPMTKTLDQLIMDTVPSLDLNAFCNVCRGTVDQCVECPIRKGARRSTTARPNTVAS